MITNDNESKNKVKDKIKDKTNNKVNNQNKKELYLIRHGETDWNKLGLTQGAHNDIGLNMNGKYQSTMTGEYMKTRINNQPFDLIICSPLQRTKLTAEIIADHIDYDKDRIKYLDQLIEVDQGLLAIGKTINQLKQDPFYNDFFNLMDS